jgi:hypothetical protein
MSQFPPYTITNEQLLLINILNGMYSDNLRQINSLSDSIYSLNESNRQIRNLLIQILNTPSNSHNRRNSARHNNRNNLREYASNYSTSNLSSGLDRIYLNSSPYIIENFEYNIPINRENANNNNISQILQKFFQPIEVFPTQSQIESATRRARYGDILTPRNRSCPISLENFNDTDTVTMIRFCGHIFNTEQLNTWFRSNCRCPVCRYDIRRYNSTAASEIFNENNPASNNSPEQPIISSPSIPLNDAENNSNQNRRQVTDISNNSIGRNIPSLFLNNIIDSFSDFNINDINNLINNTDVSGNNTESLVIFRLLNEFNNRSR